MDQRKPVPCTWQITLQIFLLGVISGSLGICSAKAQATPTLRLTSKTVAWGYYNAKGAPVLRVKSGDTVEIQTPTASTAAQDEKHPIIYVKHLEPPYYPPLARMTRLHGTLVLKLEIGADGKVLTIESESSDTTKSAFKIFKDDAEKIIRTWTFGCVGCPPNGPFEHMIKLKYVLNDNAPINAAKTVMDLPDEVTVSVGPTIINSDGRPPQKSKKGSY